MNYCGTRTGYNLHIKNNEDKCDACKKAQSDYWKLYKNKNSEKIKQTYSIYYSKNKEKIKEKGIRYHKNNPHSSRENERRRRARLKKSIVIKYSEQDVLNIYGTDCYLCKNKIDLSASRKQGFGKWEMGLHIDHVIPISKGGGDIIENVRPSHALCNLKKNDKIIKS